MNNYWVGILISLTVHAGAGLMLFGLSAGFRPNPGDFMTIDLWGIAIAGENDGAGENDPGAESPGSFGAEVVLPDQDMPARQSQPVALSQPEFPEPEAFSGEADAALPELEIPPEASVPVPELLPEPEPIPSQEVLAPEPPKPVSQTRRSPPESPSRQTPEPQTANQTVGQSVNQGAMPGISGPSVSEPGPGGGGAGSGAGPAGAAMLAGGEGSSVQAYLGASFDYINRHIRNNLVYPAQARRAGQSGTVTLEFTILRDGRASEIRVKDSSGFDILDNGAIRAVERASPFPPPPEAARIVVPVEFNLR